MDGVGVHGNIFHWNVCQQERLPVLEAAAAPHLLRHRQQGCRHRQGEGREGKEREAFTAEHSEQGNNIPACCISYRHQCTFTPTPLSCSYTLGNVQIKSRSFKKNSVSHAVTMTKFTNSPSHGHNFYVQTTGNLKAVRHTLEYLHQETSSLPEEVPKLQRMCCAGKALRPKKPSQHAHPDHTPVHQLQVFFVLVQF